MEHIEPLSEEETDRIEAEYQARKAAGTLPVISPERHKRQLEFVLRLVEEEKAKRSGGGNEVNKMSIYLRFLKTLLLHKWFVFQAGLKTGVPVWRLIIHDWSKFSPAEFGAYARNFHGEKSEETTSAFTYAWLHHENVNPHHWGYWIPRSGKSANRPLPMPETYVREMVADWMGASRAYTGSWNMSVWVSDNGPKMEQGMHDETIRLVHSILIEQGYFFTDNCPWICMKSM